MKIYKPAFVSPSASASAPASPASASAPAPAPAPGADESEIVGERPSEASQPGGERPGEESEPGGERPSDGGLETPPEELAEIYLVEPMRLTSTVIKYSGTLGSTTRTDLRSLTMAAFAHYAAQETACQYVFADIQGTSPYFHVHLPRVEFVALRVA